MKLARLGVRLLIGGLFVGHGTQKLRGWFGGPGLEGTTGMMEQLELHPAKRHAATAGLTETTGGALLATGLATPLAASMITGTMLTAIRKVHLRNGVWNTNGGWEYNAVLIAAVLAVAEDGPGPVSLDRLLGIERSGARWAVGAAALGAAASYLTTELARRNAAGRHKAEPVEADGPGPVPLSEEDREMVGATR